MGFAFGVGKEDGELFLEFLVLDEDETVDILPELFIDRRIRLGVERTDGLIFSEEEEQQPASIL